MSDEPCPVCGNEPTKHDPAAHVANAYHQRDQRSGRCQSCNQAWPCLTRQAYAVDYSSSYRAVQGETTGNHMTFTAR